jgi:hypothetical protein
MNFAHDTLFLDFALTPKVIDTVIQYNTLKHQCDTLFTFTITSGFENDYFSKLTYKLHGFSQKTVNIKFQNKLIESCPTTALNYEIVNGDTVNLINANGWKHGKWISGTEFDSVKSTKIKYYNNGQFIKGYIISERGDTTHYIDETNVEMAIPYESK